MRTRWSSAVTRPQSLARAGNTILSLGINILLERVGLDPRWRYAFWALIAANEIRGLLVVYEVGGAAIGAVARIA